MSYNMTDPARSPDTDKLGNSVPTYSPFHLFSSVTPATDRDPPPFFPCPSQLDIPFPSSRDRPELLRLLCSVAMSRSSRSLLSCSSFCHTNPTCMRLFPHVVLIIYTFSISRLFFLSFPIRQARLSSHPLSTYMRGRLFPGCYLYLSFIPSELDPAKTSLSARLARLFLIITSIQRNAGP